MFITFPEDAHWNAEPQTVEFGVEIGEYRGVRFECHGARSNDFSRSGPPPRDASNPITFTGPGSNP